MYIDTSKDDSYDFFDTIRKALTDEFKFDLDKNRSNRILYSFIMVKENNYELYKNILGIIYTDFFVSMLNYNKTLFENDKPFNMKNISGLKSLDDLYDLIEEENSLIVDMVEESIAYYILNPKYKREFFEVANGWDTYLLKISPTIFFERVKYCRPLAKEDLLLEYKNNIDNYYVECNSKEDIENFALIELIDFFLDHIFSNPQNYDKLLLDLIEDYYNYTMYKNISNNTEAKDEVIEKITGKSLVYINNLLYSNKEILIKIFKTFIEYNKNDSNERERVKTIIKKHKIPNIKDLIKIRNNDINEKNN